MSYGSNIAVEDAEDEYREETARLIAMHAAELVAARDMTRDAAITAAVEHQRYCQEAELDPTGTVATVLVKKSDRLLFASFGRAV